MLNDWFLTSHLQEIVEYYNKKYPNRPKTNLINFEAPKASDLFNKLITLSKNNDCNLIKVIIADYCKNGENILFMHSEFGIFNGKNLIIMRNSWFDENSTNNRWKETAAYLKENGIDIYLPKIILNTNQQTKQDFSSLSYQGADRRACYMISVLTAKDVTSEDMKVYSNLKHNFTLPPKILKYSPSKKYIIGQIGEDEFKSTIIKNKTKAISLKEYFELYNGKDDENFRTRIDDKRSKFTKIFSSKI